MIQWVGDFFKSLVSVPVSPVSLVSPVSPVRQASSSHNQSSLVLVSDLTILAWSHILKLLTQSALCYLCPPNWLSHLCTFVSPQRLTSPSHRPYSLGRSWKTTSANRSGGNKLNLRKNDAHWKARVPEECAGGATVYNAVPVEIATKVEAVLLFVVHSLFTTESQFS